MSNVTTFREAICRPKRAFGLLLSLRWGGLIVLVTLVLMVYGTMVEVTGFVQRAANNALFLAVEGQREMGPKYVDAQVADADLLEKLLKQMAAQPAASVVDCFWPRYSPRKQLAETLTILRTPTQSELKARELIEKASEQLTNYFICAGGFGARRDSKLPVQMKIEKAHLAEAENTLAQFRATKRDFCTSNSVAGAQSACLQSRIVSATFFVMLPEFNKVKTPQEVDRLLSELDELAASMRAFARKLSTSDTKESENVLVYADSVTRRRQAVAYVAKGESRKAEELLVAALPKT